MALGAPSCRPAQHDATTATSNQLGHCGQQAPFLTPGQVTESVPILDAPPPPSTTALSAAGRHNQFHCWEEMHGRRGWGTPRGRFGCISAKEET